MIIEKSELEQWLSGTPASMKQDILNEFAAADLMLKSGKYDKVSLHLRTVQEVIAKCFFWKAIMPHRDSSAVSRIPAERIICDMRIVYLLASEPYLQGIMNSLREDGNKAHHHSLSSYQRASKALAMEQYASTCYVVETLGSWLSDDDYMQKCNQRLVYDDLRFTPCLKDEQMTITAKIDTECKPLDEYCFQWGRNVFLRKEPEFVYKLRDNQLNGNFKLHCTAGFVDKDDKIHIANGAYDYSADIYSKLMEEQEQKRNTFEEKADENESDVKAEDASALTPANDVEFSHNTNTAHTPAKQPVNANPSSRQEIVYPNGDKYIGEVKNGKPNGYGTYYRKNIFSLQGTFEDGALNGYGTKTNTLGNVIYEGNFWRGRYHGKGSLTYIDGSHYEGNFFNGDYDGEGCYTTANGNTRKGNYVNGSMNGSFTLEDSITLIKGSYTNGFAHGQFSYHSKNPRQKNSRKEKEFKNGYEVHFSEKNSLVDEDGNSLTSSYSMHNGERNGDASIVDLCFNYEGSYKNGKYNGFGKIVYKDYAGINFSEEHGAQYNEVSYEGDFKDGLYHGQGKMEFGNGIVYKGEFFKGKITGFGSIYNTEFNGEKCNIEGEWLDACMKDNCIYKIVFQESQKYKNYEGTVHKDSFNGFGTLIDKDGYRLYGTFKNSQLDGTGTITFPSGEVHHGEMTKNNASGFCRITLPNGCHFEGQYDHNRGYDYFGVFTFDNGKKYIGEFRNCKRDGHGIQEFGDSSMYIGEWREGSFHGYGLYRNPDSSTLEGLFDKNNLNGNGKFRFSDGTVARGIFRDSQLNGNGTVRFTDGSWYEGDFKNGKYNGFGTMQFADGSWYKGDFQEDMYNGFGTMHYTDGSEYKGHWKENERHGEGILIQADGECLDGIWENDAFVKPKKKTLGGFFKKIMKN